jgi:hypothetical protein
MPVRYGLFSHGPLPFALLAPSSFFVANCMTEKTAPMATEPGRGLPRSDGFSMTVVILNGTPPVTMGRLYPQERPL